MNEQDGELQAAEKYDKRHRQPGMAVLVVLAALFTIGFLMLCFIIAEVRVLTLIALIVMILATGLEAWACYVAFRYPRLASLRRMVIYEIFMVCGGILFTTVMSMNGLWVKVSVTAMACEGGCILMALFTGIWAGRLPQFKANFAHTEGHSSLWLTPVISRRNLPMRSRATLYEPPISLSDGPDQDNKLQDSKSSDEGAFVSPFDTYWRDWDRASVLYPNQLDVSGDANGLSLQNLPRADAVEFPEQICPAVESVLEVD
jgi:hypothetical protein